MQRSSILNKHQYVELDRLRTHTAFSVLTYLTYMFAKLMSADADHLRHMWIRA